MIKDLLNVLDYSIFINDYNSHYKWSICRHVLIYSCIKTVKIANTYIISNYMPAVIWLGDVFTMQTNE